MVNSGLAFIVSQSRYGKGICNIEVLEIEVRDFLSLAYPDGIGKELKVDVLEMYGLAINFAKTLQSQEKFVLTEPVHKVSTVYCGRIPELPVIRARIVIDHKTVKFLAGGTNSFLTLNEGYPIAVARIIDLSSRPDKLFEIYFCKRIDPVS